jgi:ribosomal-protein-alanine N-acetyltransferase
MLTHKGTQPIETERLLLRRFKPSDAEYMFKNWANDNEVFRFFTRNPHSDITQTEQIVSEWVNTYTNDNCYNWAIELKEIGEIIGQISLVDLNEKYSLCEVGFTVGRSFWKKGIGTEALKAVINYLFKEIGINRIEGKHNILNFASGRVMQKSGMTFEGIMRQADINKNGEFSDLKVYSILKSDYNMLSNEKQKETKIIDINETIVSNYYDYYNESSEDSRLNKDKAHLLEYITTMHYIEKYLKPHNKVLEVGCGTGIYSLNIAKKGLEVTALDISNKNLDILRSRISEDMTITTANVNATNLLIVPGNTYDVTLLLGPLYHLFSEQGRNNAISEAKRVTKKGGLLYISFLTKDYIMMRNCEDVFNNSDRYFTCEYDFCNNLDEVFYYFSINEFEELMYKHDLHKLHMLTTDGISQFIGDKINALSDDGYQNFINCHLRNCERLELMGFSPHILYIAQNG